MSYTFSTGNSSANGSDYIFRLKQLLKSVGWTVPNSSDGTTYNPSGDQITTGTTGAGGMANASAWFRIQCPSISGIVREFTFQVAATAGTTWRIKYSYSAGFTGGSPGATRTPSATDEGLIAGSGTDASPTYAAVHSGAASNTHFVAGGATEGYSFWAASFASAVSNGMVFMDMVTEITTGDVDPYVFSAPSGGTVIQTSESTSVRKCWFKNGLPNSAFSLVAATPLSDGTRADSALGVNPYTGFDDLLDLYYVRRSSAAGTYQGPGGVKGKSTLFQLRGPTRSNGDTYGAGKDKVVMGEFVTVWDGTTPAF